jgi:hypothetical protein
MGTNGDPDDGELSDPVDSQGEGDPEDEPGRTSQNTELSREDVMFLRAIRDINESPEEYPKTGDGQAPATIAAIKHATTLSRNQINYRLGTTTNTRGFVERGFVVSHDPPMTDAGYGSRSAEITEKGEQRLEDGLRAYGLVETSSRGDPEVMDRLENLAARVEDFERALSRLEGDIERLTDRVEATNSRVSRIEEANMGAIEEPQAGRLRTVIDAMPAFYQAFQMMGMDVREIQNADDLTDEQRRELLKNVRETLDQQ